MASSTGKTRYRVSKLFDASGNVADHFLNDEFHSFCDTWEHAMSNLHFAQIIEIELQAEKVADAPLEHLAALAPTERVRDHYLEWLDFIDNALEPWTTGGAIHFRPHWARVLMHALVLADSMGLPDADLRCLAMAAVFHDSRRESPYLDTGHGARAAAYYAQACRGRDESLPTALAFDPRAYLAMAWHDRYDAEGLSAISSCVGEDMIPSLGRPGYSALLPAEAAADAQTMLMIFKDADGLDRVRLGANGLDERFLRTDRARANVQFAHDLLAAT